jgi:hypothetical protein
MGICVICSQGKNSITDANSANLLSFNYNCRIMKNFTGKNLIIFVILFSLAAPACVAQRYKRSTKNPERGLFGKSLNTKTIKYREAPSIVRAKKKQEANQKKLKKDYNEYIRQNRKRAVEIQSPEVRERMLENRKEADLKYKAKRKKMDKTSRKSDKKYR